MRKEKIIIAIDNLYAVKKLYDSCLPAIINRYETSIIIVEATGRESSIESILKLKKNNPNLTVVKLYAGTGFFAIFKNLIKISCSFDRRNEYIVLIGSNVNVWERILIKYLGPKSKYLGLVVNFLFIEIAHRKDNEKLFFKLRKAIKNKKLISTASLKIYQMMFQRLDRYLINQLGIPIDDNVKKFQYVNKDVVVSHVVANKNWLKYVNDYYANERAIYFNYNRVVNLADTMSDVSGVVLFLGPFCIDSFNRAVDVLKKYLKIAEIRELKIRPHPRFLSLSARLVNELRFALDPNEIIISIVPNQEINYQIQHVEYLLAYHSGLLNEVDSIFHHKVIIDCDYHPFLGKKGRDTIMKITDGQKFAFINDMGEMYCAYNFDGSQDRLVETDTDFISVFESEIHLINGGFRFEVQQDDGNFGRH